MSRALLLTALLLGGCAHQAQRLPAIDVAATAETTAVTTANADAADDPAIWRNPADPSASLIVGTDKKAGLYVYGLDGGQRSFFAAGNVNNVDLRADVMVAGKPVILIGASDRADLAVPRLALFALDPASAALTRLAVLSLGQGEAYGFCFGVPEPGMLAAYIATKQGQVLELPLDLSGATPATMVRRTFSVKTQPEGCVVDDATHQMFLGEENEGIWRFDLSAAQPVAIAFAKVGAKDGLVADVEGLALAPDKGWLIASSQGDNAYAVFDIASRALVGRFRISGGPIDSAVETDGIELVTGDFGPAYPEGLFVAQDGDNAPEPQNFKLVSWRAIKQALEPGR